VIAPVLVLIVKPAEALKVPVVTPVTVGLTVLLCELQKLLFAP
jgi:hypothetical protein